MPHDGEDLVVRHPVQPLGVPITTTWCSSST
jgi:hypothetical protein